MADDPAREAHPGDPAIRLTGLPIPLRWQREPARWTIGDGGVLTIEAGAQTDLFVDPGTGVPADGAARLVGDVAGDFTLESKVEVAFASTFDAGALLVWVDGRRWGKLAFELSPQAQPMIVSVVARGLADDANAFDVTGAAAWLRISRLGNAFAFHASRDGATWAFVRQFALDAPATVMAGFLAQSPTGPGCSSTFSHIRMTDQRLAALRSGV